jgi:hypothetical protein
VHTGPLADMCASPCNHEWGLTWTNPAHAWLGLWRGGGSFLAARGRLHCLCRGGGERAAVSRRLSEVCPNRASRQRPFGRRPVSGTEVGWEGDLGTLLKTGARQASEGTG